MPGYCDEQADCLKGIDIRDWPGRCYACGHASAQAQAEEIKSPQAGPEAVSDEFAGYSAGMNIRLIKSGALCEFVEYLHGSKCTIKRLDTGKEMVATLQGIEVL